MLDFDKKTRTADYNSRHESYQNDTRGSPDGREREMKTYTNRVICCPSGADSLDFCTKLAKAM